MRARKHFTVLTVSAHIKLHRPETIYGCTITSRGERKEFFALFIVEVFVNNLPEPFGLGAFLGVALYETAVLLPGMKIEYSRTTDKLFEFLGLEQLTH